MYLSSAGSILVEHSTFNSNAARSGGALAAIASTTLNMQSSRLIGNAAGVNGGGVMVVLGELFSTEDFYENNTAAAGGAAFFLSSEATLARSGACKPCIK